MQGLLKSFLKQDAGLWFKNALYTGSTLSDHWFEWYILSQKPEHEHISET